MSFTSLMEYGHTALGMGHFDTARNWFESAGIMAGDTSERCRAAQMYGVTLRLQGEFARSELMFQRALELAGDDLVLLACIQRDYGMTVLDRAVATGDESLFVAAATMFGSSYAILTAEWQLVEAAATEGFIGRLHFEKGEVELALAALLHAHKLLHGMHPVYELNNLVWVGKVSLRYRWRFAWRVFRLAATTGHGRRLGEYTLLLLGGNALHEKLRRR